MKFKEYVKAGVGLSIGVSLGFELLKLPLVIVRKFANSDYYMDNIKDNSELYEQLKKYRTKGEDESN